MKVHSRADFNQKLRRSSEGRRSGELPVTFSPLVGICLFLFIFLTLFVVLYRVQSVYSGISYNLVCTFLFVIALFKNFSHVFPSRSQVNLHIS